jgi:hypothetical protein
MSDTLVKWTFALTVLSSVLTVLIFFLQFTFNGHSLNKGRLSSSFGGRQFAFYAPIVAVVSSLFGNALYYQLKLRPEINFACEMGKEFSPSPLKCTDNSKHFDDATWVVSRDGREINRTPYNPVLTLSSLEPGRYDVTLAARNWSLLGEIKEQSSLTVFLSPPPKPQFESRVEKLSASSESPATRIFEFTVSPSEELIDAKVNTLSIKNATIQVDKSQKNIVRVLVTFNPRLSIKNLSPRFEVSHVEAEVVITSQKR